MHVGIIVGFAAEARIARRLGWRVAIGGGTPAGARTAAQRLIDDGCDALISFGLAGGLDPALRPGALIVPAAVIDHDAAYPTDVELSRLLGGGPTHELLAVEAVIASVEAKRWLRARTSAAAVDMESGAVACVATKRSARFAALRAVCDPAERAMPGAALAALDADGAIDVWRVGASILAQPRQLPALVALAFDAAAARRSLIARVRQIIQAPMQTPAG